MRSTGIRVPKRQARDEERPTPNLFIVGAPKSGTTALASYLGQHPEVFVAGKELSYFGSDLDFRTDNGGRWHIGYDAYLGWFARHGQPRYRTDRSVFYLYSAVAASEIQRFDPDSRVIALLRDPVEQMHSQHSEMLFQGDEDIADFADALAAEEARRRGDRLPVGCRKPFALWYRDIARYAEQVERYLAVFGSERVCVVLYDDIRSDPAGTYRGVLEFLGLDPAQLPDFDVVNANKVVRSAHLRDLLRQAPPGVRRVGRMLVPNQFARASLRRRMHALNTRQQPRRPVSAELRAALVVELAPEVRRLEALIGRDLRAWLAGGAPPATDDRGHTPDVATTPGGG
jgi:hypothetical protein